MFGGLFFLRGILQQKTFVLVTALLLTLPSQSLAQSYEREIASSGKSLLTIKNPNGRVSVIASTEQKDKVKVQPTSPGAPVEPGDIHSSGSEIIVRERRPPPPINLTLSLHDVPTGRIES